MDQALPTLAVLQQLFDGLPIGVVVLDAAGAVVHYNRQEERLAQRSRERVLGKRFFYEVAPCLNVRELGGEFERRIGREPIEIDLELTLPRPHVQQPRDVLVRLRSFEADRRPYGVLLVEDVSAERAIDRMKDTLASLLVHDLKSPLAVLALDLQLLGQHPALRGDPDAMETYAQGRHAARRLERMILNLLDITRLETHSLPLQPRTTDVAAIARAAVEDARILAQLRDIALVLDAPAAPVERVLDAELVRRAVDNLIDNALKHSRHSGRVVVSVGQEAERAWIAVADDGPGVPEDVRERIFEKYVQATLPGVSRGLNRGLGLTFVQLVARAHGGLAEVEPSEGRGGAVFRLSLCDTTAG